MELKTAFDNMVRVCKNMQLNFDQHKVIERSIEAVWDALKDKMVEPAVAAEEEPKSGAV